MHVYTKQESGCCTTRRTFLVRSGSLNMTTGEYAPPPGDSGEWVTGPCNVPLFGADALLGTCKGCRSGWTHPENFPAKEG
jgi:hypothetical protein